MSPSRSQPGMKQVGNAGIPQTHRLFAQAMDAPPLGRCFPRRTVQRAHVGIDEGFGDRSLGQAVGLGIEDVEEQRQARALERGRLVAGGRAGAAVRKAGGSAQADRHGGVDGERERERCFAAAPFQGEAVPAVIVVGDEILLVRRPLPQGEGPQMIERERRIG